IERLASSLRDRGHCQTRCGRKRFRGRRPERMHMKVAGRVLTSLVLVCATTALAAAQGAPVDEQALKKEVNAFMDQYWSLWSAGDIDQLAARIYHPFGLFCNAGETT